MADSRRGSRSRTVALAIFGLLVGAVTALWSIQIIRQGFALASEPAQATQTDGACRAGVLELASAVERARQSAAGESDEQAAVEAFRRSISSGWSQLRPLERRCANDSSALAALRLLRRLRYAEEHTVRYAARDVARWRLEARELDDRWAAARSK